MGETVLEAGRGARPRTLGEAALAARTLHERAAGVAPVARAGAEQLEAVAAAWARAFAAGDRAALARRLAWDGLEPGPALERAAADAGPEALAPPDWLRGLERFGVLGADLRGDARAPALDGVPFPELWRPWAAAAVARLAAAARGGLALPRAALAGLAEELGRDLARISERAAWEAFAADRGERPGAYAAFVERQLAGGLTPLYLEFPVLLRQSAALLDGFEASLVELLERTAADRAELARAFGADVARWSGLARLASDRHAGGRQVWRLDFEGGAAVVYKPRGVEPEALYARVASWLADRLSGGAPPAARALERPGYGWMEWVAPSDPGPGAETERWYRRAGALVALADLLGAEDLHAENLIATREGPVAVDLEMLLAPARSAADLARGSALRSGLLAAEAAAGADRIARWAGLEPVDPERPLGTGRAWRGLGGDDLRPEAVALAPPALANAPRHGGRPLRPAEHAQALCAGFAAASAALLAGREELLAAGGPLAGAARVPTRLLVRASQDYATLLDRLTDARCQRDGRTGGYLLEASLRVFAGSVERPRLWPLAAEERAALTALDVPRFELPAGSTALPLAAGGALEEAVAVSGLERLRRRFARWSEEDLRAQAGALAAALAGAGTVPALAGLRAAAGADGPLAAALAIGRALARRAQEAADGAEAGAELEARVRAASLYDGAAGRALALAALAGAPGGAALAPAARAERERFAALARALARERAAPVGGFQGVGSWIWTLVWLHRIAGDAGALELAAELAAGLDAERLAHDARLDVEGGAAGALLALLALHEADGGAGALARARAAGEHLLARAEPAPGGLAWRGELGRPLAGFAHGAAGVARALGALARATGEERYGRVAGAALAFERALFDARRGNWPVVLASGTLGEPRTTWMTAWCHGAAGIGLARLFLAGAPGGELDAELEAALRTTAAAGARGDDHLCCGGGGRASILGLAARRRGRADWEAAAGRLADEIFGRAVAAGDFRLPRAAAPGSASPWGLMRGRAGLAWLAAERAGLDLPSPLALELPSEAAARRREER